MQLARDLTLDYALYGLKSHNKREVIHDIVRFVAKNTPGIDELSLFDQLYDQERRLGSGIGNGIAIPHMRVNGLQHPLNIIVHLDKETDFQSTDGEAVKIVWVTLSPRNDGPHHLMRLAKITRMMRDPELAGRLCESRSIDEMRAILMGGEDNLSFAA